VSDIAAMTANRAKYRLPWPEQPLVEAIDMLYEGIRAACNNYKVDLVGGDTTSSASGLVISITAVAGCQRQNGVAKRRQGKRHYLCDGRFGCRVYSASRCWNGKRKYFKPISHAA